MTCKMNSLMQDIEQAVLASLNGQRSKVKLMNSPNSIRRYWPHYLKWATEQSLESFAQGIIDSEKSIIPAKTVASHQNSLRRLLETFPGHWTLDRIGEEHIQQYVDRRTKGVRNSTINRELAFLSKVYNIAISQGDQLINPVRAWRIKHKRMGGRKPLPEGQGRTRYLTLDEISALLRASQDPLRGMIEVSLFMGLRQEEIFGLRWDDIDLQGQSVSLYRKWKDDWTQVPLPPAAEAAIRRQPNGSLFVFPGSTGGLRRSCRTAWRRALRESKLRGVTFHTLRHTFASHAMMQGMDLPTLKHVLGHQSLAMTMRYAHLAPGRTKRKMGEVTDWLATELASRATVRHIK